MMASVAPGCFLCPYVLPPLLDFLSRIPFAFPAHPSVLAAVACRRDTHETKGTDLGGKRGRGTDLTTDSTEVDELDFVGVDLRGHLRCE